MRVSVDVRECVNVGGQVWESVGCVCGSAFVEACEGIRVCMCRSVLNVWEPAWRWGALGNIG